MCVFELVHWCLDSIMESSIAQLVERTAVNRKVASSNLAGGVFFIAHFQCSEGGPKSRQYYMYPQSMFLIAPDMLQ